MSFSIIFDEPQLMFGNESSENWTSIKHISHVCIIVEKPPPPTSAGHVLSWVREREQIRSIIGSSQYRKLRFMCYNIRFNLILWQMGKCDRKSNTLIYPNNNGIRRISISFTSHNSVSLDELHVYYRNGVNRFNSFRIHEKPNQKMNDTHASQFSPTGIHCYLKYRTVSKEKTMIETRKAIFFYW